MTGFDAYARDYRNIINKVSQVSGEQYEFFIKLRVDLMKGKLDAIGGSPVSILDFGCGIGATELFMEERFPNAMVRGVDMSQESLRAARELPVSRSVFDDLDSDRLPYSDGVFDLIYTNGTMHHIPPAKHGTVFSEFHRVLCQGGHLFVFENNPLNPFMMRAMKKIPFDADAKVVTPGCLKSVAIRLGLTFKCINYYFFFPRALRCLRPLEKYFARIPMGAQYFLWYTK